MLRGMAVRHRSISAPITLMSIAVLLALGLLVGWTMVIVNSTQQVWLLVLGIASFAFLVLVLILSGVGLARRILELRRQNTFIDSVTHELKSPLASLRLCLETLERTDIQPPQRAEVETMMREDVERLEGFIDDVLEASRLSHGRGGVPMGTVVLAELVRDCVSKASARRGKEALRGDGVSVDVPPELAVHSNRTALSTIFKNLIDNAVKYSDEPVQVDIRAARRTDGRVVVTVSDRGIGIPRDDLRRIFSRFYRVDDEAVRARHGTGLGLFVVAQLARSIGGRLAAESAGPGTGTTMTLTLPRDAQ